MKRHFSLLGVVSAVVLSLAAGCRPQQPFFFSQQNASPDHYKDVVQEIEYPDANTVSLDEVEKAKPPLTLDNPKPTESWDLTLEQAVQISLSNSAVLRNLGGVVFSAQGAQGTPSALMQSPATAATMYVPGMEEANARTGVEAALSAFDAQFASAVFWEKNRIPQNIGGFYTLFIPSINAQDVGTFQAQIRKYTAVGTQVSLLHEVDYLSNNSETQHFQSAYTSKLQAEIRQPLLQGNGVEFNRIAGPGATPGAFNGVMIARLRVDQSLADFEGAVRNLTTDVEKSYWNLYYAYRRLSASIAGRDASLQTWRQVKAKFDISGKGGSLQEETQARQQYYQFEATVKQSQANLYKTERVLRYMLGLAASDGRLIYPIDEPTTAKVAFDWCDSHSEALTRSVELRKQKWRIKQVELELIASKNFLMPKLDGVARYGWYGLGHDLVGTDRDVDSSGYYNNSYASMTSGDNPFWHLGLEMTMPFGYRREMSGVRYAQMAVSRERKVLQEQELELSHQLQDAFNDLSLNYQLAQTQFDRRAAAVREVEAVQAAYDAGTATLDLLLDAQRRRAEAETEYFRSLIDYNLSISNIHYRKGSLLEYNGVCLAEGPWPAKAYFDARRRARARDAAHYIDYGFTRPAVVSQGPLLQQAGGADTAIADGGPMPATAPMEPNPNGRQGAVRPEAVSPPKPDSNMAPDDPLVPTPGPASSKTSAGAKDNRLLDEQSSMVVPRPVVSQNRRASQQGAFDLGAMNLNALAGKSAGPSRSAEGQRADYQQSAVASQWRSAGGARQTSYESNATPSTRPVDPASSGWSAVQH
jgi:outer membrane protein TolC